MKKTTITGDDILTMEICHALVISLPQHDIYQWENVTAYTVGANNYNIVIVLHVWVVFRIR